MIRTTKMTTICPILIRAGIENFVGDFGVLKGVVSRKRIDREVGAADVGERLRERVLMVAEGAEPDARRS
ncbi:transport protein SEC23-like [Pyrus ussuriensis x Pyrus communis]|uniref:Transport protein SEC23-like n=1 Tax=Pyrus ussuriensis x Pyrus communis TaxID=2448454 RepID=A0A5N5G5K7_9ROSA|nr:transport protein SEC23-like [Pyrus ussuriensis x Pyrus communis]